MNQSSSLHVINSRLFGDYAIWMKRDDLLHPFVSGNKFRKLKYLLPLAEGKTVVSMGGPWSNHLHALAYAAHVHGLASYGFVRGLIGSTNQLTATLQDCISWGMQLQFVSREDYRRLRDHEVFWRQLLPTHVNESFWLPEGGKSLEAMRGVMEIPIELHGQLGFAPDYIICACGSGTTLAGLIAGTQMLETDSCKVIGISAVKNGEHLYPVIQSLLQQSDTLEQNNFELMSQFDHGGFAKTSPALLSFCEAFTYETGIPIEPIYTGKMLFALSQLCRQQYFPANSRIVALHTGGLQGLRGFASVQA